MSRISSKFLASDAVTNIKVAAGAAIDATKIADGSVSNSEFQRLNGVSSDIQTQLDSKQDRSTLTAKGDLYVATASNTVARQAVGTNGTFLKADSLLPNGITWSSVVSTSAFRSVTTTDTATTADDILVLSGASFTQTLFTAVGNTGKEITIIHNGTNFSQQYTLATTSGQTIGGVASGDYVLHTNGELLRLISDGSNWLILEHRTKSYFGSLTTTGSWNTNTTYTARYWREGDMLFGIIEITLAGAPNSATLSITLPSSLTIDTNKIPSTDGANIASYLGDTFIRDTTTAANNVAGYMRYGSSTTLEVRAGGATGVTQAAPFTFANGDSIGLRFQVPITGWRP